MLIGIVNSYIHPVTAVKEVIAGQRLLCLLVGRCPLHRSRHIAIVA